MPRFQIPNTNVSFQSHLRTPFGFGTTNNSLNTVGSRIFPRRTSPTAIGDIRNIVSPNFVYQLADVVTVDDLGFTTNTRGTVQVNSPMTIGPATLVSIWPTFVIDSRTYSTITLQCNQAYGFQFLYWTDQNGSIITANNPATISLSNSTLFNASLIKAVLEDGI